EAVFTKMLLFNLFEFGSELVKLLRRNRSLPNRKHERVFNCSMMFVHPNKRFESTDEVVLGSGWQLVATRHRQNVVSYFATAHVLHNQEIDVGCGRVLTFL